ncbi:WAT1-related protein At3g18200 isoform X4 [Vigna angularis]|uniref:WAT1-related protein At3g18200 isoform X4 n=1 Tax=Phaseolus angularis TaxID=3914 RepID=UPI00080A1A8F|nr:WAT1-related protein At3g18200 isoform X4 [Vigna angularis]
MSNNELASGMIYVKFRPHLLMLFIQMLLSFLYFLVEASLSKGMNPHVFVTYRHVIGGIAVLPFAYVRERLEVVDVKKPRGVAKVFGTVLSLIGALIMTLYKGHTIQSLRGAPFHVRGNFVHNNWIKGSLLAGASCISWSLWFILQAVIAKKYQAQLSLTVWINCMGAAQSAIFAVIVEHKPRAWLITSTVELCCVFYAGAICGGLVIFIQFWTAEQKGPVFVSMFNPLGTILVAILAYFLFGEQLHTGSLLGVVFVIIGLYLLLWGKESDRDYNSQESLATDVEQRECRTQIKISAEQEVPQRNVSQDTN